MDLSPGRGSPGIEDRGKTRTESIGAKATIRVKASAGAISGRSTIETMWTAPAIMRTAAAPPIRPPGFRSSRLGAGLALDRGHDNCRGPSLAIGDRCIVEA